MRIIAAVIAFFAFAMPVHAQFEQLQFAICKKVIAESDRLKCYDAIGTKPHATSDEPIPVKGKWVYMESKLLTDDSDQVLANACRGARRRAAGFPLHGAKDRGCFCSSARVLRHRPRQRFSQDRQRNSGHDYNVRRDKQPRAFHQSGA
jgi:hypothetical protein